MSTEKMTKSENESLERRPTLEPEQSLYTRPSPSPEYKSPEPRHSIFKSFLKIAKTKFSSREAYRRRGFDSKSHAFAFSLPTHTDRIDTTLPVSIICMLLVAEFSLHYFQRLILTWLSHLIASVRNRKKFSFTIHMIEFTTGPSTFLIGMIADSYTGKYWPILIGSILAVLYSVFCFIMTFYHELSLSQTLIVLFQMPILHIFGGVRWAFFMEQVSIPRHFGYLETHVFLATFVRNLGRSMSVLVYVFLSANYEDPSHAYISSTCFFASVNLILIILCKKAFTESVYPGISFKAYRYFGYCVSQKYKHRKSLNAKKIKLFDYGKNDFDLMVVLSSKQLAMFPVLVLPFIFNSLLRGSLISIWDMQQRYVWRPLEPDITMTELYNYACVLFLPLVHFCFKPLMKMLGWLTEDIHYISLGYALLCLSITATSITHFITDKRGGYLYEENQEIVMFNAMNTSAIIKSDWTKDVTLPPRFLIHIFGTKIENKTITVEIHNAALGIHKTQSISIENGKLTNYLVDEEGLVQFSSLQLSNSKRNSSNGASVRCYFLDSIHASKVALILSCESGQQYIINSNNSSGPTYFHQNIGKCNVGIYDTLEKNTKFNLKGITFEEGGVYGFFLYNDNKYNLEIFTLVQPAFKSYVLYPQLFFAVLGDCITIPAIMKYSYLVAPRKVRSTLFSYALLADGIGEGILCAIELGLGGANSTVLNIGTFAFFGLYVVYIVLIAHINYQENIQEIA